MLPRHIAIIMDGNGRWAKKRLLPRNAGHKAGAQALRKLAEKMNDAGYENLTVYAFSTENWKRPDAEVSGLMDLLSGYIQEYIDAADKNDMRICVIGDLSRIRPDLRDKIRYLEDLTRDNSGMRVNIALNYGGRDELVRATRRIAADIASGKIAPDAIDETLLASYLDTHDLPDPDLLIRTGGEARISNFMLWQISYAEFFISQKLWPDFTFKDLQEAVGSFGERERRFGRS